MPVTPREGTPFSWSKDAQAHPWLAECHRKELGCYFYVSATTEEAGQVALALHTCPHRGGPTKIGLLVSRTLLEETWEMLDEVMDTLMDGDLDHDQTQRFRGEARGIAKVLSNFMQIYFPTVDDIAREAKRRYDARKAGDTEYCTQGLGSRKTEFPEPGFRIKPEPQEKQTRTQRQARSTPAVKHLPDEEKNAIKVMHSSGMFTVKQLAETYKVTPRYIEQIITQPA